MNLRFRCLWPVLAAVALAARGAGAEPPEVTVCHPVAREVTDYDDFTGRVEAMQTVEIRARVGGFLEKISFKEGTTVKRGDVLFEIDSRPYRAELEKAEAEVLRIEARLKRVSADLERLRQLLSKASVAREDVDRAEGDRTEAQAAVVAARAAMSLVRLNLEYTRVTAPIDGRIGRALLDVGNVVRADTTHLATIASVDRVYVTFSMDERTYLRRAQKGPEGKRAALPVAMALANETGWPHQGKLDFVDTAVDAATGTLRTRAGFANSNGLMLPGMFARVRLAAGEPYKALLIPQDCVGGPQGQAFVFAVTDRGVAEKRPVKVGALHDALWIVTAGLTAEDRVVVGRFDKSWLGKPVNPKLVGVPIRGDRSK